MNESLHNRLKEILDEFAESRDADVDDHDTEDIYIITIEALETAFKDGGYTL